MGVGPPVADVGVVAAVSDMMSVQPCTARDGRVVEFSSFIRSKSNRIAPLVPLISNPLRFWLPVAWRAASKLATAPPEKRARKSTVSSTVTWPFFRRRFSFPRRCRRQPRPSSASAA